MINLRATGLGSAYSQQFIIVGGSTRKTMGIPSVVKVVLYQSSRSGSNRVAIDIDFSPHKPLCGDLF